MKSSLTISIAIILGGLIVSGAIYFSLRNVSTTSGPNTSLVRSVDASDHILGNPAAPVVIIEYSDFDCDFCKGFSAVLHQIIANEGASGKVAFVFRQFPLTEIHPNSFSNARASECAAQVAGNDAFWRFEEALFASQPIDPSQYGTIATKAGISSNDFATCYATASSTLDARITADRQNALDIGATGTPYSIILAPGKEPIVINGAYPYDAVKLLVDQALGS